MGILTLLTFTFAAAGTIIPTNTNYFGSQGSQNAGPILIESDGSYPAYRESVGTLTLKPDMAFRLKFSSDSLIYNLPPNGLKIRLTSWNTIAMSSIQNGVQYLCSVAPLATNASRILPKNLPFVTEIQDERGKPLAASQVGYEYFAEPNPAQTKCVFGIVIRQTPVVNLNWKPKLRMATHSDFNNLKLDKMPIEIVQNVGGTISIPVVSTGSPVTECAITPTLPPTLKLVPEENCKITGYLDRSLRAGLYQIKGSNAAGMSTISFRLDPDFFQPYPVFSGKTHQLFLGRRGVVKPLKNLGGTIANCKLSRRSDPLPEGLVLDPKTCVISGISKEISVPRKIILVSIGAWLDGAETSSSAPVRVRYFKKVASIKSAHPVWQSNQFTLEVVR